MTLVIAYLACGVLMCALLVYSVWVEDPTPLEGPGEWILAALVCVVCVVTWPVLLFQMLGRKV